MGFHTEKIPSSIKGKEIPGTFLFGLYLEYFSLAIVKVRSAVTYLQPNLEWGKINKSKQKTVLKVSKSRKQILKFSFEP